MIVLDRLTKSFPTPGGRKYVLRDVSVTFPDGQSVALLGRNGAGKSTLLRLISGSMTPDSGQILSAGQVSFPVGFAGSFHKDLTGAQNARFVARIYGADTDGVLAFVRDFAGLGAHFHMPVRSYSSGMRSRLAFGTSMALQFDTYLVDEVTSVGDAAFRRKSTEVFKARMRTASAIVASHSMNEVRKLCTAAVVLEGGAMTYYADLEEAIAVHEANMADAA